MPIHLPDLPYDRNALAPHISEQTLDFHYGKHHQGYVGKLNAAIDGRALDDKSLEEIITTTANDDTAKGIFNNAAQVWNHTFYWNSLSPNGGGNPNGALAEAITKSFGDMDGFHEAFAAAANTQFGSGWAWLVKDGDGLSVTSTSNADLPLAQGQTALLTLDVWEHAYYLDYQNRRPDYVDIFLNELINWEFAGQNFDA